MTRRFSIEHALDQVSAMCRDAAKTVEVPAMDIWFLVNLASMGIDAMFSMCTEDPNQRTEFAAFVQARGHFIAAELAEERPTGTPEAEPRRAGAMYAALAAQIIEDRYEDMLMEPPGDEGEGEEEPCADPPS
jgi:hypothetical protein